MSSISFPYLQEVQKAVMVKISIVSQETEKEAIKYLAELRLTGRRFKEGVKKVLAPYKEEIDKIEAAAKPWQDLVKEKDDSVEAALLQYRAQVRQKVAAENAKSLERYERRVETATAKAVEAGKPMPLVLPPALKAEPQKTVEVDGARVSETKHLTWTGIAGVLGGKEAAKKLNYAEAQALGLDLPPEWFKLDGAAITACVKRRDRIPKCVLVQEVEKLSVTELEPTNGGEHVESRTEEAAR